MWRKDNRKEGNILKPIRRDSKKFMVAWHIIVKLKPYERKRVKQDKNNVYRKHKVRKMVRRWQP